MPAAETLSLVHGIPLEDEPGLGALTIPGYLRDVTTRFARKEAVVYPAADGMVRWSYEELWHRSVEVARALIACGVGKDSRVGVMMTNRPEWLAAMFGTALAGGVTVALSTFSTPPELEHLLKVSGVSVLLLEREVAGKDFAAMLTGLEPAVATSRPGEIRSMKFPVLRRVVTVGKPATGGFEGWQEFVKRGAAVPPSLVEATAATTAPSDTGVLFFSSGTTSMPKGIIHSHRAVALQWWRMPHMFGTKGDVRFWTANGLFWSGNFSLVIGNALTAGGAMVLQSTFIASETLELIRKERVNFPMARPHQWARIAEEPAFASADFSRAQYIDPDKSGAKQPTINTEWRMPQSFGTTETLAICISLPLSEAKGAPKDCYGRPLPGNILKIVDPMTGVIVPRGKRGELAIKGPTLMTGYLGKTSEQCFDDEGYYRTGDGGFIDDNGRLFWEGRLTDMIKTGGANVSPLEVDIAIAAIPGVKLTQTVGVPDDMLGEMVVGCIVPQEGVALDDTAIRAALKDKLASFKIPRRILFFREDELPMAGSAKIKATELRDLAAKRLAS
jgi:acyl-CoA synthetase (AMP-forming)/AMP-acid ligase II